MVISLYEEAMPVPGQKNVLSTGKSEASLSFYGLGGLGSSIYIDSVQEEAGRRGDMDPPSPQSEAGADIVSPFHR